MRSPAHAVGPLVVCTLLVSCGSRADPLVGESNPAPSIQSSSGGDASVPGDSRRSPAAEPCDGEAGCHGGLVDASAIDARAPSRPHHQCVGFECDEGQPAAPGDGGVTCVNVDLSAFDRSCKSEHDCIYITAGTVCSDGCMCGNAVVNADGQAQYERAIAPLHLSSSSSVTACNCPNEPVPSCVRGQCVLCYPGADGSVSCG